MMLRIANGAGFLGDSLDAPRRLVEGAEVDYLTLEYLAELTMSILARARQKDPRLGFARDFLSVTRSLLPSLQRQTRLRLVTNAGGVNPRGCTRAVAEILVEAGFSDMLVGLVEGDDLLPELDQLRAAGEQFTNSETRQPWGDLACPLLAAHAYLGAGPIVEALKQGARFVITGRVADASLTVGPAVHEFGWSFDDWPRLAAASVAGHLIECGAQVTGGYSERWRDQDLTNIGYPIAELMENGGVVITKPESSGGVVDRQTVVRQLVYEIGDPARYYTPDVVADFSQVTVQSEGTDRVIVGGAVGQPAPDSYKVSMAYQNGYTASSQLLVYGPDCLEKAGYCARLIFDRLEQAGIKLARTHVEKLGAGIGVPSVSNDLSRQSPAEVVLRITAQDESRDAIQTFVEQFAPLITNGPAGLAGYASGRGVVRPVLAFWPTTVPRSLVTPTVEAKTAAAWAAEN